MSINIELNNYKIKFHARNLNILFKKNDIFYSNMIFISNKLDLFKWLMYIIIIMITPMIGCSCRDAAQLSTSPYVFLFFFCLK